MNPQQQPLLGILGGMGPLATVDFLGKLTRLLPVSCDQEHLPWITLSQPGMPDRSQAIQNNNDGPLPYLTRGVAWLAAQGVGLICIPCSTSHYWFEHMQAACSVPILHIADATIEALQGDQPRQSGLVAVMATRGTIRSGIYGQRLLAADFEVSELGEADQVRVDDMIHKVKIGDVAGALLDMREMEEMLATRGIGTVILGCTELPLAHNAATAPVHGIDVSQALAMACLRRLGYQPAAAAGP